MSIARYIPRPPGCSVHAMPEGDHDVEAGARSDTARGNWARLTPAIARRRAEIATLRLQEAQARLEADEPVDLTLFARSRRVLTDAVDSLPHAPDRVHVDTVVALDRSLQAFADALAYRCRRPMRQPTASFEGVDRGEPAGSEGSEDVR